MYPTPEVVRVPITESLSYVLVKEHPAVFGVFAPTWAQALKGGDAVKLSLFASAFSEDKFPSVTARKEHQPG